VIAARTHNETRADEHLRVRSNASLRALMQQSIVRRSLIVTAAFVVGHFFHYALVFSANRLMEPAAFGRLYVAISLLNVLATPATVLSFMFAKHFGAVFSAGGVAPVVGELNTLMRRHGLTGLGLLVLCAVGLFFLGSVVGADAFLLLLLIPAVALAIYLFEMARAALQGMLEFYSYSAAWILWRGGQYILAVGGIALTGTAWAGMAGILVATIVATLVLLQFFRRCTGASAKEVNVESAQWAPFRGMEAVPFALQYGILIILNNVDVLVAYLILSKEELGVYSASSFLPKAIVTATLPVAQVMLPVMTVASEDHPLLRTALLKALGVAAVLSATGAAFLAVGSDLACNERFGIRFCAPWLLSVLAFASIPLSISRVLVVAGLALHRVYRILPPAALLAGFVAVVLIWVPSPYLLAATYTGLCWLFVVLYSIAIFYTGGTVDPRPGFGAVMPGGSPKDRLISATPPKGRTEPS
jgi:O-antigen/teichoic acid export membrane protein